MLGLGAMMHLLSGGSGQSAATYYGRVIKSAELDDNRLRLCFEDGCKIEIFDDGQSCCEDRYMRTDDDVASLVGRPLVRIESKGGPTEEIDGEVHETCFVEIGTDAGFVTLTNHNEHNGYYGGFGLTIKEIEASATTRAA